MGVYARILRIPGIAVLVISTTVTRLPFAINSIAVVLFLRETTGSFAVAGFVAGALALGAAAGAPLAGRLVDRRGARMLMPLAVVHAAAVLSIWALGRADVPAALIALPALTAGASFPPAGALLRSRLPYLLRDPELVHGAYALDSVNIELSFVTGPLITAVLVAVAGPEFALGASAVLVLAGTSLFLSRLPREQAEVVVPAAGPSRLGPLADPAIRMVALSSVPVGICIGCIEVALPAFAHDEGSPALAGVLLAVWSAASGVGGLVYGARPARDAMQTFFAINLVFPLACLPLVLAESTLAMIPFVVLAGVPIAALIASRNQLVGQLEQERAGTESFTWLMTALVAGLAVGNAVGGTLSQSQGWEVAVLVGVAVAALGAALAFAFRETLRPRLVQPAEA